MKLSKAHQEHINNLKSKGVPVSAYEVACCGSVIETQTNTTLRDWDTLADCPVCGESYIKITLAESKGVLAVAIGIPREEAKAAQVRLQRKG